MKCRLLKKDRKMQHSTVRKKLNSNFTFNISSTFRNYYRKFCGETKKALLVVS